GPLILFATSPSLDDLRIVNVYISSSQIQSTQTASSFQAQIIKCREFIFTEPDVIGSPSYESENCFHLITQ
ncbi:hypothetical protein ACJMK2_009704, partial [Sinanodonta woodiana]